MGRLSLSFALFSAVLVLVDISSAARSEVIHRLKRSPQMPQMPQPPSPPGGFPNPPSMPSFRRIVRQIPEDIPEGPPGEFPSVNVHSVHPQTRTLRHVHGSEVMGHVQERSNQMTSSRLKREARGTGGKFPNRGG